MDSQQEKITKSVSTQELERRWKLVREKMQEQGIDYLVAQNSESYLGGTIRWFTDFNARHQMPFTVIFPVQGEMTTIVCGVEPPAENNWPPLWASRGIGKHLGHCYLPTIPYTSTYDADLAIGVMKEKSNPKIGLVEPSFIPMTFYEHLRKGLPTATFVDATDLVDQIRCIKSPEEIELIRDSAALCDSAIEALKKIIRPGIKDCQVRGELHAFLAANGCERGIVMVGSGPQGTPVNFDQPRFQNRVIRENDYISVLIEFAGPGGYYTEIFRPFVVGRKPIQEMQDIFAIAVEVQEMVASKMVSGVKASDMWNLYDQYFASRGMPPRKRTFAHAQGYSYIERPNLRPDETWMIKPGMNIAVHPYADTPAGVNTMVMDNYIVGETKSTRIHKTPKEIIVV